MKKLLITGILLLGVATAGVGQGRISFQNDSLHLVYLVTDPVNLLPADLGLAGKPIPAGGILPSGFTLEAELWAGTASSALQVVATNGFSQTAGYDGIISTKNIILSWAGGTPSFFQVRVHESGGSNIGYFGETSIFTTVPSTSFVYNSIVNPGGQAQSTWAVGTQDESGSSWGAGARGAMAVQGYLPVPPYIFMQPTSQVVTVSAPATLSVGTHDAEFWQWRLNGANIPGATSSAYALASAQFTNAGTYSVTVWNRWVSYGGYYAPVTSSDAVLQVLSSNWWTLHGTDLVLGWTDPLVLQDATNVLGPFHDVPGAASPYPTNVLLHPQLFFRWRQ